MKSKIFYRERQKVKDGSKTPRYRIVAVSSCDIKVYCEHFRKSEINQLAAEVGAELVKMERGKKHQQEEKK